MPRLALGLEYDGSAFAGWQWQRDRRTVQACVEAAVARVADEAVDVVCAGRTDAGVHALEQVAHFDTGAIRALRSWLLGINTQLPDDVRVTWVTEAGPEFHARTSAVARYYRYVILNRPMRSALQRQQVTWVHSPLNAQSMQDAALHLLGDQDFSSFRAQGCQSKSPSRIMHFIRVAREGERVIVELCANAFLHHMVRNIVGVLLEVGAGKREPTWARDVLEARDRKLAGVTAPADGLYLGGVLYPAAFGMPKDPIFDWLPPDAKRFVPGQRGGESGQ